MARFAPLALACLLATAGSAATAQTIAGWDQMVDNLRGLPGRMLAKLPEEQRRDPQVQQEVGRLAMEAFTSSAMEILGSDGDFPMFLPQVGLILNAGQPNADTIYRTARLTPGASYRLRGQRGSLRMFRISQSAPRPPVNPNAPIAAMPNLGPPRVDHDFNKLKVDGQGRFDVILSPTRPAGWKGDWWELRPNTNMLLMRMVSSDWGKEREPTIAIERIDGPASRGRRPAADLQQRLARLTETSTSSATLFVDHVAVLRRDGFINRLKGVDLSQTGGLAGQFYYEGAYDLRDGEALILEVRPPAKCLYRSILLTNDLYETIDWYNAHSSLNDSQAKVDKDGLLRFVVSARDPGVANWLDTAGHPTGVVQGRWTECDSQPIPTVRKVALADVRRELPPGTAMVTPEQRDRIVRDRRLALQQRPLW